MSAPGVMAGSIGRFTSDAPALEPFTNGDRGAGLRVLDVQPELTDSPTTTGRAACQVEVTRPDVAIDGTLIDIDRRQVLETFATEFTRRGRVVSADTTVEEGGGVFPFTLLSAVTNVKCEALAFDTEAIRKAWRSDGTLSDTWLAGSKENGDSTVMAYGAASEREAADIGLGFERSWSGFMLRGVIYSSGYISIFEELTNEQFLRFVTEELVPHGYVPEDDDAPGEQGTLEDV